MRRGRPQSLWSYLETTLNAIVVALLFLALLPLAVIGQLFSRRR